MQHVVVVGGGVGGLGAALLLARAGRRVTVFERDVIAEPDGPDEAFAAERRGAPQVHQTHGFLARLQVVLRDHFPDVHEELLAAGGTTMSTTADLGGPQPGDEDLKVLIVRRTTLDLVLRRAALAQAGVEVRTATAVTGLTAVAGEVPRVTGVRLDDGAVTEADVVVIANGRRSILPAWLREVGVDIHETVRESGLMYFSRWYRLPEGYGAEVDPKLGGDLGFVKYLAVPGDRRTLSVTLAVRTDDAELRDALLDDDHFDAACRALPGPGRFFDAGPLEPIGGVRPMGGLLNRVRRFVDEQGHPLVRGLHAIGDAHTCTNPLYGRGCSLALVQAVLLAQALTDHPSDEIRRSEQYEAACAREVTPWFDVSVQMDRLGADPTGFSGGAEGKGLAAVFAAAATDPVIGRALVRFWNLMTTPAELASDPVLLGRVAAVMADPDSYPVPPREGPSRRQLLAGLGKQRVA